MAPLPTGRISKPSHPFEHVGLDLWGPMLIQIKRSKVKRWGFILNCLASRAYHLKIGEDLATSAFIQSLMRFLNRRGQCTKCIYSDCGSNFKGADDEFKSMLKLIDVDRLKYLGLDTNTVLDDKNIADKIKEFDSLRIEAVFIKKTH